jgi:hypothetical protein
VGGGERRRGSCLCYLYAVSQQPLLLCSPLGLPARTIASHTLLAAHVSGAGRGASWAGLECAPANATARGCSAAANALRLAARGGRRRRGALYVCSDPRRAALLHAR